MARTFPTNRKHKAAGLDCDGNYVETTCRDKWSAARVVLKETQRDARRLDVERVIAAAGRMLISDAHGDDQGFAEALDLIVRYGYDAAK